MRVYNNLIELIGRTPLVKLEKFEKVNELNSNIIAKVEYFNPSGSVKDRAALAMIEEAEKANLINKDTVIIEPTSGNTGIGLALICAIKGYRLILTMPETMSVERRNILKAYGAEVVLTAGNMGMNGSIQKAEELKGEMGNAFIPQQFNNPANSAIHKVTTAKEILDDLDGKVDIFIAGVGTGGTVTGVAKGLKEYNKDIKIVAVEPETSAVMSGEKPGPHKIQGIGAGFIPEIVDMNVIDEVFKAPNEESIEMMKQIAKLEGVFVGISSGAALYAAKEIGKREENKGKNIVVLLPDTGMRYLSMNN
ncbi:cysteine synthase A [Clostridium cochlearium]|uniref:cysteine synthase A n=1 Tax=Clostridium cochlearium TaxID=1494 RepID=UPI000B9495D6|nr:cysteine synthase A [Clostridium cochlearium]MBV1820879.1 cysteine synthase A [Bacteroidales bacterium MSK.15.36]NSJ92263.1 cysteine synthase A [Coprococcus sp. MSK.21.13]MCG4570916.1 cysteine synthase A [Clostridium cochlearium]MCG4579853.1 cysteine synthase A [Clostridium cochlearium]MCR1970587.1 cysteine synthase A [Clostridium cochlearium]